MRRITILSLLAAAVGLALASLVALRWLLVVSYAGGLELPLVSDLQARPLALVAVVLVLVSIAALSAIRLWTVKLSEAFPVVLGVILAALIHAGVAYLLGVVQDAMPWACLWIGGAGLLVAIIGWRMRRQTALVVGIAILIAAFPCARSLSLVTGDALALQSVTYGPPPSLDYGFCIVASLALFGMIAGCFSTWLKGTPPAAGARIGALIGSLLAVSLFSVQIAIDLTSMASGHDPLEVWVAAGAIGTALAVSFALAAAQWRCADGPRAIRLVPCFVLLVLCGVLFPRVQGYSAYSALKTYHAQTDYAYVHFTGDGSWLRTLDQGAPQTRVDHAQRFLAEYPHSAYRSAAMLILAAGQYDLWRFREASRMLYNHSNEYPLLVGYRDVLRALANLAAGNPVTLLQPIRQETTFALWRKTCGAQLAAVASEQCCLFHRALGYYSGYIDYLHTLQAKAWAPEAIDFANARMEKLLRGVRDGTLNRGTADVRVRVMKDGKPVPGIRLILVQPHPDAALPADSRQFTGAWSVPAWNGRWAVSKNDGMIVIPNIPYGSYEVVVGVKLVSRLRDYVIRPSIASVNITTAHISLPDIELVPSVQLVLPAPCAKTGLSPTLVWKPYPGAACYSVSVIALAHAPSLGRGHAAQHPLQTVWARSRIEGDHTALGPRYFLCGLRHLETRQTYMWLVCAYDHSGKTLSTSEHYFQLQEPTFSVDSDQEQGGIQK